MVGQRIIDTINQNIADKKTFFSFEYFPPKTEKGKCLIATMCKPTFAWNSLFHLFHVNLAVNMIGYEIMFYNLF
jgi:5,10-methylenetetrahydrofolate reductase